MIRRLISYRSLRNREGVFNDLDKLLGVSNSSSVEYVFTKPQWKKILTLNSSVNPYGHALVQYDHPDVGKTVMNVCGQRGSNLINFFPAEDYLFTDKKLPGDEQGGIFNRSFIGTRIEDVGSTKIRELHDHYQHLDELNGENKVVFSLFEYLLTNPIRRYYGCPIGGNCTYWTSDGLQKIGLVPKNHSFPMFLLLKLMLTQKDLDSINIISYRSVNYHQEPKWSFIHPFHRWFVDLRDVWHYDKFANIVIKPIYNEQFDTWGYEIIKKDHVRDHWLLLREKYNQLTRW